MNFWKRPDTVLTDSRHLFDLILFILAEEKPHIKLSIQGIYLNVIFDGTSHCGKALAILVRYIDDLRMECATAATLYANAFKAPEWRRNCS